MQKFYRLSVNIVKILTLLLAVFLFIGSFLTTCYAENMETQQVLLRFDNPLPGTGFYLPVVCLCPARPV